MPRHHLRAYRNFDIRIRRVKPIKARPYFIGIHRHAVEINDISFPNLNGNKIFLFIGPGGGGPEGRFTRMPFMWAWLKLTIMKLASRKNMMSIKGMISIRAFFLGKGEEIFIANRRRRSW